MQPTDLSELTPLRLLFLGLVSSLEDWMSQRQWELSPYMKSKGSQQNLAIMTQRVFQLRPLQLHYQSINNVLAFTEVKSFSSLPWFWGVSSLDTSFSFLPYPTPPQYWGSCEVHCLDGIITSETPKWQDEEKPKSPGAEKWRRGTGETRQPQLSPYHAGSSQYILNNCQ